MIQRGAAAARFQLQRYEDAGRDFSSRRSAFEATDFHRARVNTYDRSGRELVRDGFGRGFAPGTTTRGGGTLGKCFDPPSRRRLAPENGTARVMRRVGRAQRIIGKDSARPDGPSSASVSAGGGGGRPETIPASASGSITCPNPGQRSSQRHPAASGRLLARHPDTGAPTRNARTKTCTSPAYRGERATPSRPARSLNEGCCLSIRQAARRKAGTISSTRRATRRGGSRGARRARGINTADEGRCRSDVGRGRRPRRDSSAGNRGSSTRPVGGSRGRRPMMPPNDARRRR